MNAPFFASAHRGLNKHKSIGNSKQKIFRSSRYSSIARTPRSGIIPPPIRTPLTNRTVGARKECQPRVSPKETKQSPSDGFRPSTPSVAKSTPCGPRIERLDALRPENLPLKTPKLASTGMQIQLHFTNIDEGYGAFLGYSCNSLLPSVTTLCVGSIAGPWHASAICPSSSFAG